MKNNKPKRCVILPIFQNPLNHEGKLGGGGNVQGFVSTVQSYILTILTIRYCIKIKNNNNKGGLGGLQSYFVCENN